MSSKVLILKFNMVGQRYKLIVEKRVELLTKINISTY